MKNRIIFCLAIASLSSGCGMFRKIEKTKSLSETSSTQTLQKQTLESDTGTVTTTKKWYVNPPMINGKDLQSYAPPTYINLGGSTDDLKSAMLDLQKENSDLFNLLKKGSFGYEEQTTEKKGTAKATSEAESKKEAAAQEDETVKKTPDSLALFIGGGIFLVIVGLLLIVLTRLSNKVKTLTNIVGAIKS